MLKLFGTPYNLAFAGTCLATEIVTAQGMVDQKNCGSEYFKIF